MDKITVGILGATSYTGVELVKILARHPQATIAFACSRSSPGVAFSRIFGEAKNLWDGALISFEEAAKQQVDCIFSCLPHAVSAEYCTPFIAKNIRTIDLSADFRIREAENYTQWYQHDHPSPQLLKEAVFGLPEHYRDAIKKATVLANPGCYPTSILLPLLPLYKTAGVSVRSVIADSKSGVSGAGRALKLTSLYAEANENIFPYSIGRTHRHIAEIEQELSLAAGKAVQIIFSPHLAPFNRGILSTIYIDVNKTAEECSSIILNYYRNEPFIRIRTKSDLPKVSFVAHTNYCDIAFTESGKAGLVIAVCAIDNLIKGASGQAVQNMNIMFGFNETAGLI